MQTKVELSVIIVSYNTCQVTRNCLESIYKFTKDLVFEVIVVDNSSHDDSVKMLQQMAKQHGNLLVLPQKNNPGFGCANNIGAKNAKGEYLLFINSDTYLEDNNFKNCLTYLKKHPQIGALSCQLNNTDGSIQPNGGYFPNLINLLAWQLFIDDLPVLGQLIHSIHPKANFYQNSWNPDWITGAYLMISKELFNLVDGFDPKIFMYGEDLDVGYKVHKANKKVHYLASEHIVHLGNASSSSAFALTHEALNMGYVYSKYHSDFETKIIKTILKLGALLRWTVFGIIQKDEKRKSAYRQILANL